MDVQLNELIEQIKKDGIRSAEESASRIIAEAEGKASAIIQEANEKAASIRQVANVDAEKTQRVASEALSQAGRDLIITVQSEITRIFDGIIKNAVGGILKAEQLSHAVDAAVQTLAQEGVGKAEIQIPENEFAAVEEGLMHLLSEKFASGFVLVPFKELDAGFRITMKDGSAFYDFSDDEIAAMLSRFLNPRLRKLLEK